MNFKAGKGVKKIAVFNIDRVLSCIGVHEVTLPCPDAC